MALRSFLYLLGASLTVAGCFFPWSCRQVGDLSWHCPTAIMLRYSMHDDLVGRLEMQDNVRGSGFIVLLLTAVIVFFAFSAPQFIRRARIIAIMSSAALVLVSAYHFVQTLTAWIRDSDAFASFTGLTLAIVCSGALMMLVAGTMKQHAMGQQPARRTTAHE